VVALPPVLAELPALPPAPPLPLSVDPQPSAHAPKIASETDAISSFIHPPTATLLASCAMTRQMTGSSQANRNQVDIDELPYDADAARRRSRSGPGIRFVSFSRTFPRAGCSIAARIPARETSSDSNRARIGERKGARTALTENERCRLLPTLAFVNSQDYWVFVSCKFGFESLVAMMGCDVPRHQTHWR
jgi:hypothetical protein